MVSFRFILSLGFYFIGFWAFAQSIEINKATFTYKDTLNLDYYSSDLSKQRQSPLLILVHGGGFASGKKDGPLETDFILNMAQRGYPVVSIEYRLTRKNDPFNCDCHTEDKIASFVSGSEDLAAALQFIEGNESLIFDRSSIVLIGSSAGAELILHSVFMNNDYRFSHIEPIHATGLISLSGAMTNSSYINKNNAIPSLFIHGKKDDLVPFATAPHHFCSEDRTGYLMLDGPLTMSENLKEQNSSFIVAFNEEGNHDWANIGYLYTDLIHQFIQDLVVNKKIVQSFIELNQGDYSIKSIDN